MRNVFHCSPRHCWNVRKLNLVLYLAVKPDCTDDLILSVFSCYRGVASGAAEDSSLSKFHYLFLYNKEMKTSSTSVC